MTGNDILAPLLAERPHLFSAATVAISQRDRQRMEQTVAAIERVVAVPAYQEHVLGWAPEIARVEVPAKGACFGYDFHLTERGPRLIEVNTNAGGAMLCARQAHDGAAEHALAQMFIAEAGGRPASMAIVDENPAGQYLYPEFLLYQALMEGHGVHAVICDPADLMFCHGGLWHGQVRLDLVYNRLTDFELAAPACAALRQAYLDKAVTVTPHPRAHALFADKRNLAVWSDPRRLAEFGVDAETRDILADVVPMTVSVTPAQADDLWARRRSLFFKPAGGFGSRAAYRGDKITRRVFEEVLAGSYVAQALVPPSTVMVHHDGAMTELKADIRCYVYDGCVQLVAARLWQGQTTNFRTPGGGFARVVVS